jgi:hypothetical protein
MSGSSIPSGVRICVFAGNYVNISTTPLNAGNSFSQTYFPTGLPLAKYYVLVQSPVPTKSTISIWKSQVSPLDR